MYNNFLQDLEIFKKELDSKVKELEKFGNDLKVEKVVFEKKYKKFLKEKGDLRTLYRERYKGFPILAEALTEYLKIQDLREEKFFDFKIRRATKTAERVKLINEEKRYFARQAKINENKLKVCLEYVPDLMDVLDREYPDDDLENLEQPYTEKERQDSTSNYLTVEEYRALSQQERNQLALDRYKKRRKDSKGVGMFYERFVGYLFEEEGYKVKYEGIIKGKKDRGVDLLAMRGEELLVIQCKNWAKYKTIFENVIFQLYGSSYYFEQKHPDKKIVPMLYCTTKLDDFAKNFSDKVGIEVKDNHWIDYDYPMIKCNISKIDSEKIYHLPMDQQYDKIMIEKNQGEFYCKTVQEAEESGFRRSYRYKGFLGNN